MFREGSLQYIRKRSSASIETSRISLVVMELVTAFLSLVTVIAFGYVLKFFHWECPLYSQLKIDLVPTKLSNDTVVVNPSKWGQNEQCWFPLSISVLSAMGNFIWAWLLLHFKMRIFQEGIYHSYVFMSMIFEVVMFIFSFASSLVITLGQKVWCDNMLEETRYPYCHGVLYSFPTTDFVLVCLLAILTYIPNIWAVHSIDWLNPLYTCKEILSLPWEMVGIQRNMHLYMQTAKVSSWMTTASLLMVTLFALIRFYGGPILHVCSKDKGEHYMTSPDAGKSGLPYSALPSDNSGLGFENNGHSINDDHIIGMSSSDD